MRAFVPALATVAILAGCGGGDDGAPTAKTTATATATALGEDALLTVHDNLVTCAQQHDDLGLVAHLSGEQAVSDSEGVGGGEYDDHLAAPKATVALTGTGAQFVGLRADTRHKRGINVLYGDSSAHWVDRSAFNDELKLSTALTAAANPHQDKIWDALDRN